MSRLFKILIIETKNVCTRRCWFCKFGQERRDEAVVEMDWAVIERIIGNLSDLKFRGRVSWYGTNEPLLDGRMLDILKLTRRQCPQAFLSLLTNGDLLAEDRYRELRAGGLDALGVSVYDDETFEKVSRMRHDRRLVVLDRRALTPARIDNRGGNIAGEGDAFDGRLQEVANRTCARPFTTLMINARGDAVLCCSDVYGDVVMGDAKQERLEVIWRGPRFEHYRGVLRTTGRRGLTLCEGCSYSGAPPYVSYPRKSLRRKVELALWRARHASRRR